MTRSLFVVNILKASLQFITNWNNMRTKEQLFFVGLICTAKLKTRSVLLSKNS